MAVSASCCYDRCDDYEHGEHLLNGDRERKLVPTASRRTWLPARRCKDTSHCKPDSAGARACKKNSSESAS